MVDLSFDDEADNITCEGCGASLPTFLDGCPYCDEDDEEGDTLPCPSCGAEIFDSSEKCAICGAWVTFGASSSSVFGGWKLVLAILLILLLVGLAVL